MKGNRYLCLVAAFFLVMEWNPVDSRRYGGGGGGSRRVATRAPPRRTTAYSSQRVTTPRYNIQTQQAYPNYNQPSYNRPSAAQKVTTPRYNYQTQQSYPNYNQPGYNQPHYNQPGYNQPHYNQPHYNQPGYNQPHYNQPGYNQPFGGTSGIWQQKKDHGVRNSVLAGLGGSALGLYLGYKLGGLSNNNNGPNYMGGPGGSGYPQYSVVHHYHHGDQPIPKDGKVEEDVIKKCDNVTFCTPNTSPLCMTNGTVYCIAAVDSTINCNDTNFGCVNSTITLPCDNNSTNCNGTALNTTSLSIPCVTTIDVFGDFGSNKLSVNKISKRSADGEITTVLPGVSASNDTNNGTETTITPVTDANATTSTSTTAALPISILSQTTRNNPSSMLTSHGISNKYCVTVIAEPIKEPEMPPNMNNHEFAEYLNNNPEMKKEADEKVSDIFNSVLGYIFF